MISQYLIGAGIFYTKSENNHQAHELILIKQGNRDALRDLIKEELLKCPPVLWPRICEKRQNVQGLHQLTEWIVEIILQKDMCIGSAIVLLERELIYIL